MTLIITILIFLAWLAFLSNFLRQKISGAEVLLLSLLGSITQIYLSMLFLATAFHRLNETNTNIVNSIIIVLLIALTIYFYRSKIFFNLLDFLKSFLRSLYRLVLKNPLNLTLFILGFIIIARAIIYTLILTPFDWDGLEYHLPAIIHILQTHAIIDHTDFRLYAACIFPFAQELLVGYSYFIFHTLNYGMAIPITFLVIAWLAIYEIFKTLSFKRTTALFGALLFSFVPALIVQLNSFYIDVAFSSLFIVTMLAAVKIYYQKDKIFLYSAIGGISAGLLLASKYTALFALPAILIIYVVALIRNKYKIRDIAKSIFIIFFAILLTAGFWYIKNAVNYKNPLAPYQISAFGHTIFQKYNFNNDIGIETNIPKNNQPAAIYNASWPVKISAIWSEALLTDYNYDVREGGLGVIWWAIFLPAIVFSLIIALIKKERRDAVNWLLMFTVTVVPFLLFGYSRWWTRYIIFIVPFGIFSYLIMLKYLPDLLRKLQIGLIVLLCAFIVFVTSTQSYWSIQTLIRLSQNRSESAAGLLYGNIWQFMLDSSDKTIIYGEYHVYLATLFGKDYSNHVYYFEASDCDEFIENVDRVNADWYLVINQSLKRTYMDSKGDPQKACLEKAGRLGSIIYGDENSIAVYEIKKP